MQTNSQPLLFVGGDLSGIQKFLYNITSQKAAVSLKGRSAYLVNFTQKLCTNILSIPPIAAGNRHEIIYCSGGKFYLITDDSPEIRQSIDAFYHRAEQQLWREHCGQLGIAIAYIPFCFTDDTESKVNIDGVIGKIGELWRTVNEKFTTLKNQKFHAILKTQYDTMFEVQPVGGDVKVCAITGIESAHCVQLEKDGNGEAIWVLPSVKEQMTLGENLRKEEHFKTFEEYANGSYLGVLRMDVDGMGERILRGFANMKEYHNFSEKLKSFFEGKNSILHQLQQAPAFKENLNIIYAGGDDLFVVGRWSSVLDYADELRKAFARHTQGEGLTISGGMVVVGAKFPIAKAAEMAGDAEEQAKKYTYNGKPKNAICFLGESVSWNQEFDEVKRLKDELVQHLSAPISPLPNSLLQQLLKYANMAKQGNMQYLWHAVYHIARLKGRQNGSHDAFLNKLCTTIVPSLNQKYTIVALSARWAELELRNR